MNIIWKTLMYQGELYENLEVSTNGEIRNVKTGTVYKSHQHKQGYLIVTISLGSRKNKKNF